MRLSLLAVALFAASTATAQKRTDPQTRHLDSLVRFAGGDTAAIRRAAVDSGWHVTAVQSFEIVGDTAWMTFTRRAVGPFPPDPIFLSFFSLLPGSNRSEEQTVVGSTARVERRNGQWVRRDSTLYDFAAILRAARTDTSDRILDYSGGPAYRAAVTLVNPRDVSPSLDPSEGWVHRTRKVYLHRRGGTWVADSSQSMVRRNGQWVRDSARVKPWPPR